MFTDLSNDAILLTYPDTVVKVFQYRFRPYTTITRTFFTPQFDIVTFQVSIVNTPWTSHKYRCKLASTMTVEK